MESNLFDTVNTELVHSYQYETHTEEVKIEDLAYSVEVQE